MTGDREGEGFGDGLVLRGEEGNGFEVGEAGNYGWQDKAGGVNGAIYALIAPLGRNRRERDTGIGMDWRGRSCPVTTRTRDHEPTRRSQPP